MLIIRCYKFVKLALIKELQGVGWGAIQQWVTKKVILLYSYPGGSTQHALRSQAGS